MSIIAHSKINASLVDYKDYSLAIKNNPTHAIITMFLKTPFFHTKSLPGTHRILKNDLPQVLQTQCFNDSKLPFDLEVKDTEIGHLFEHILLQYLCQIKIENGHSKASFRGITNWNWIEDERGTFHIKIDIDKKDYVFFEFALQRTIVLFDKIIKSRKPLLLS